jgi:hypothetical protein
MPWSYLKDKNIRFISWRTPSAKTLALPQNATARGISNINQGHQPYKEKTTPTTMKHYKPKTEGTLLRATPTVWQINLTSSNFGKTRKIGLQQFVKPTWQKWKLGKTHLHAHICACGSWLPSVFPSRWEGEKNK